MHIPPAVSFRITTNDLEDVLAARVGNGCNWGRKRITPLRRSRLRLYREKGGVENQRPTGEADLPGDSQRF